MLLLKIKEGYSLLEIDGYMTVCDQENNPFNNIVFFDEISVFIWNIIKEKQIYKNALLDAVLNSFEISTVLALGEIDKFVRTLKENGILEE